MRLQELYYKHYKEYRNKVRDHTDSLRASRVIKHANAKDDLLKVTRFDVDIDSTWIEKIEEGLIFVEKAILEDRRFIRHEGETLLIEKVKKTSRESIEHLSKHTNYITKVPKEGEMLIPDKLYIVEKLHDYAVYENRFLLLLLTYLNDFLYQRLDKIKDKLTTYESYMIINKDIKISNRTIKYELEVSDVYKNEPFLTRSYRNNKLLERMEMAYYYVETLLKTELMREVAKTPLLKPPIVKTNVLRMNQNFKRAVDLYEYMMAYIDDGYKFVEKVDTYNPFDNKLSDDIALSIEFQTFLSYKYGNQIEEELEHALKIELAKEEELRNKQEIREIERLRRRVKELGLDFEQYILLLEKRNSKLEQKLLRFDELEEENLNLKNTIIELEKEIVGLNETIVRLEETIKEKEAEIVRLIEEHEREIIALTAKFEEEIALLKEKHEEEINQLHNQYLEQIENLKEEHSIIVNDLNLKYENMVLEKELEFNNMVKDKDDKFRVMVIDKDQKFNEMIVEKDNEYNTMVLEKDKQYVEAVEKRREEQSEYEITLKELSEQIDEQELNYKGKYEQLNDESNISKAMLYSFKQKHNIDVNTHDFTSRDKFRELELIRKSFNEFFKNTWKETKAIIRTNAKEKSDKILEEELKAKKSKSKKKK